MATKLDRPLKREIVVGEIAYMLTIDPTGLKLTVKGKRNGQEYLWADLVSGQASAVTRDAAAAG
jgi:hypothetical protein